MLDANIPCAVLLSVSKGVPFSGIGCPSLMHAMRRRQPCLAPRYTSPVSDSEVDDTAFLIFWQRTSTRPFFFYSLSVLTDIFRLLKFVLV